jgi:hypothetical protein
MRQFRQGVAVAALPVVHSAVGVTGAPTLGLLRFSSITTTGQTSPVRPNPPVR